MFCILKSRFRQRPMQIVCQSCQHTTTDVAQVHAHRSHIHRPYGPNICHVMPPHVTALAITFCEMAHFGVRFGPFRTAKRPILQCVLGRFATHYVSTCYKQQNVPLAIRAIQPRQNAAYGHTATVNKSSEKRKKADNICVFQVFCFTLWYRNPKSCATHAAHVTR